jgi:hypothetical protein
MFKRLHLVEVEDLAWFPASLRDLMTEMLRGLSLHFRQHEALAPLLKQTLEQLGTSEIVDLCSGAGGVLPEIQRELHALGCAVSVTFTDRYPNAKALSHACGARPESLRYIAEPVDAGDLPRDMRGLRTLFTSFHHFKPELARAILADAHAQRAGIAVFEFTERTPRACFRMLFTPLACWVLTPRVQPRSARRLFWTYVLPIVPFALTWDGMISNLRTYSLPELEQLVAPLQSPDYSWRIGQLSAYGQRYSYVIGLPEAQASRDTRRSENTSSRWVTTDGSEL